MKQKLFDLKCAECHKVFREKKKRKPKSDKSLYQIMKDLAKYNKKHGTKLSYG